MVICEIKNFILAIKTIFKKIETQKERSFLINSNSVEFVAVFNECLQVGVFLLNAKLSRMSFRI